MFKVKPVSVIRKISADPVIYECTVSINDQTEVLDASALGRTEAEAEKLAHLKLLDELNLKQQTSTSSFKLANLWSDADKGKVWFAQPKNYLNGLAVKFKKVLKFEDVLSKQPVKIKAIFDAGKGLEAEGSGDSKKEASHNAALNLCKVMEAYMEKNGPPMMEIPEYKHYLSKDLPDASNYYWYANARNEAAKIASALSKTIVCNVEKAPLDPSTYICNLNVDPEMFVTGYGRYFNAKEAVRLAAVDLCKRFGHLAIKSPSSTPLDFSSNLPSSTESVAKDLLVENKVPEVEIVMRDASPVKKPIEEDNISVASQDTYASDKAMSIVTSSSPVKAPSPKKEALSVNKSPVKAVTPAATSTTKPKKENKEPKTIFNAMDEFTKDELKVLETAIRRAKLGPPSMSELKLIMGSAGSKTRWEAKFQFRYNDQVVIDETITALKKRDTLSTALKRITGRLDRHNLYDKLKDEMKKNQASDLNQPLPINPPALKEVSNQHTAERAPANTPLTILEIEEKPCIPGEGPFLKISFPELTLKSLEKWFQNPKNIGRLSAISSLVSLDFKQLTGLTEMTKVNVTASILEHKSVDLLQDLLRFRATPRGAEISNYRNSLPIFQYRDEILDLINRNQVSLISGENGYGKSTQVPNYILEQMTVDGYGAQCNVIVVTSSSLAGRALTDCIAEERGESVGVRVNFLGRTQDDVQRFGSITFCTGAVFLERLQKNSDLYGFSHVVVDNIEDYSLTNDLLLHSIKKILDKRPELRLVLLSSLIEMNAFSSFFDGRSFNSLIMAPFGIQIQQYFLEDYLPLLDKGLSSAKDSLEFIAEESRFSSQDAAGLKEKLSESMPYSLIEAILGQLCKSTPPNEAILVFLPSGEEISTLHRYLVEDDILNVGYVDNHAYRFIFIHSHIKNLDDVYRVDYRGVVDMRKIFLCTAEAESHFPTTDVVHVIDTCKYKPKLNEDGMLGNLGTYKWISQVECVRRSRCAGRALGVGSYYSLMSIQRFSHLTPDPIPASSKYDSMYISLVTRAFLPNDKLEEVFSKILHPIVSSKDALPDIRLKLKKLGAFEAQDTLSVLGKLLVSFPLPVQLSNLLLHGLIFRCLDPVLIIASSSMTGSPFMVQASNDPKMNPYSRNVKASGCHSDQLVILDAFQQWWNQKAGFTNKTEEQNYCQEKRLSLPVLVRMAQCKQKLMSILLESGVINNVGKIFARFLASPESKDGLISFLNEFSTKRKLLQAVIMTGLYPNLALVDASDWRQVKNLKDTMLTQSTCIGSDMESYSKDHQLLCVGFANCSKTTSSSYVSELTRGSPLTMALLLGTPGSISHKPHEAQAQGLNFLPSHTGFSVDGLVFFGYPNESTGMATARLQAYLEYSVRWIFARLAFPQATNLVTCKEFTEEELVRFVDNVVRTTVSLLEAETTQQ